MAIMAIIVIMAINGHKWPSLKIRWPSRLHHGHRMAINGHFCPARRTTWTPSIILLSRSTTVCARVRVPPLEPVGGVVGRGVPVPPADGPGGRRAPVERAHEQEGGDHEDGAGAARVGDQAPERQPRRPRARATAPRPPGPSRRSAASAASTSSRSSCSSRHATASSSASSALANGAAA